MPYSQDPPPDFVSELGMRVGLCHVQLLYGLPVCKNESCELICVIVHHPDSTAVNLRPQLS